MLSPNPNIMTENKMFGPNPSVENERHAEERRKMLEAAKSVVGHPRAERPELRGFIKKFHNVEEYGKEVVSDDIRAVERAEKSFNHKEGDVISEAFEISLIDLGELAQWLGDAKMQRSSKFDDYFRGIDGVAEFRQGEDAPHRIALVIDATIGKSASGASMETVRDKVERNIAKVINREVNMKYFKSAVDGYKGKLENIIPVVVGVEGKTAQEIITLYAEIISLKNKEPKSLEDEKKLAYKLHDAQNHPAQIVMLEQIRTQAQMYIGLLENLGEEYSAYLQEAVKLNEISETLLMEKADIETGGYANDNVLNAIRQISEEKTKSV
jgi:hypothetical protein